MLECKNKVLNTNETSLNDVKVTYEKSNRMNHMISLVIICFLFLVVISVVITVIPEIG